NLVDRDVVFRQHVHAYEGRQAQSGQPKRLDGAARGRIRASALAPANEIASCAKKSPDRAVGALDGQADVGFGAMLGDAPKLAGFTLSCVPWSTSWCRWRHEPHWRPLRVPRRRQSCPLAWS